MLNRLVALALLTLLAACSSAPQPTSVVQQIALRTQAPPAANAGCMAALATGQLDVNERSGLGLRSATGETTPVVWPYGYSAWIVDGVPTLVDERGQALARRGDQVELGGGVGQDGFWYPCAGDLELVGPAP